MGLFAKKVEVTFIDDATGKVFAVAKMRAQELPETFELETTLHIDDTDWSVVDATPPTRPQYSKTRQLTLRLSKLALVDPSTILFSLPTIANGLPEDGGPPKTSESHVLFEDDWRQVELVSLAFADQTAAELMAISTVFEKHKDGLGFRELHVRSLTESPISDPLPLGHLAEALGAEPSTGLSFRDSATLVRDGYVFHHGSSVVYGIARDGNVDVIGIDTRSGSSAAFEPGLSEIAKRYGLELVDWCLLQRAKPDDQAFLEILSQQ